MKPNIILIVLDCVRSDHLSCYGYHRQVTPCIDAIAKDSLVFLNTRSASCWTLPSHGSIFTGCYPSVHRADYDTRKLSPNVPTLAEILREDGYETIGYSCNMWVSGLTHLDRGFQHFYEVRGHRFRGASIWAKGFRWLERQWRKLQPDRGTASLIWSIRRWLHNRSSSRPFFLFVNLMECHLPYALRPQYLLRYVPNHLRRRVALTSRDAYAFIAGHVRMEELDFELLQAQYDGALKYVDDQVGQIYEELQALDLLSSTVLIITSDHGENFGEHGLMDHQYCLYETLLKVPLLMRLPGTGLQGKRITELAQTVDIMPTLLRLVDSGKESRVTHLQGVDLLHATRRVALAEYLVPNTEVLARRFPGFPVERLAHPLRAITDGRWKYIWHANGQNELYDLQEDPHEQKNLIAEALGLAQQLDEWLHRELGPLPQTLANFMADLEDESVVERLRALGYL